LQARAQGGTWRVRVEDLDRLREQPGAASQILRTLEAYGLYWDGQVTYQSRRLALYWESLTHLIRQNRAYYCACTRRQVEADGKAGPFGTIYAGRCRGDRLTAGPGRSVRAVTHNLPIGFSDENLGYYSQRLQSAVGDFIIYRGDGSIAYQLAVVIDDAEQGVTQVVRGADLLDSTPRQIHLQQLIGLSTPSYLHLPVAVDHAGQKLSKQTLAQPISLTNPRPYLIAALRFLNQDPPAALAAVALDGLWRWAVANWCAARIPRRREIETTYRPSAQLASSRVTFDKRAADL